MFQGVESIGSISHAEPPVEEDMPVGTGAPDMVRRPSWRYRLQLVTIESERVAYNLELL